MILKIERKSKYSVTRTGGRWVMHFENPYQTQEEVDRKLASFAPIFAAWKGRYEIRYSVTFE